jgi:hypothetical protein
MRIFTLMMGVILLMVLSGCKMNKPEKPINEEKKEPQQEEEIIDVTLTGKKVEFVEQDYHTLVHKGDDLLLGTYSNIQFNQSKELILVENNKLGSYLSPVVETEPFTELVASWNAITTSDNKVELQIQVRQNGSWSKWFTYGKWSLDSMNFSIKGQEDSIAKMSIDTINVKNGLSADAYRYQVVLTRTKVEDDSPKLHLVASTVKFKNPTIEAIDLNQLNWQTNIEVPINSQMLVPGIGNSICSPTSLTMLMRKYGVEYTPQLAASKAKDAGTGIYGNWSYNVAVAGANNLEAYVSRLGSIDELKQLIAHGTPIAVSITVKNIEDLEGAPMAYPVGHLLVVRGFNVIDGVEYVIVNDPAAPNNETVNREYKLEQFSNIWKNYVYIINERSN